MITDTDAPAMQPGIAALADAQTRISALETEVAALQAAAQMQAAVMAETLTLKDAGWRALLDPAQAEVARLTAALERMTAIADERGAIIAAQALQILRLKARVLDLLDAAADRA